MPARVDHTCARSGAANADVLAGRKTSGKLTGKIMFGGEPPTRQYLRRYAGYVEQMGAPRPGAVHVRSSRARGDKGKRAQLSKMRTCKRFRAVACASVQSKPIADTLLEALTVKEMLRYTAELKMPVSAGAAAKAERVDQVIHRLALEACADTVIGSTMKRGISGTQ